MKSGKTWMTLIWIFLQLLLCAHACAEAPGAPQTASAARTNGHAPSVLLQAGPVIVSNAGAEDLNEGQIRLKFTFRYADELTLQLLKDGRAYPIQDWRTIGTARTYGRREITENGGELYSSVKATWKAPAISIPQGMEPGAYTLRLTARNRDGLTAASEVTVEIREGRTCDPAVVAEIAQGEIGYKEKKDIRKLDDKSANEGTRNYTKYAEFFDDMQEVGIFLYNGDKNGFDWCDIFVDWCFVQAYGYDRAMSMLRQPERSTGAGARYSYHFYEDAVGEEPMVGAQIFIDWSGQCDSWLDIQHSGLVYDFDDTYVYTVEGNVQNMVACCQYKKTDPRIYGYGYPFLPSAAEGAGP